MFVVVLVGVVVLGASGWVGTSPRTVEDEIGARPGAPSARPEVLEVAGDAPVVVRERGGGSPRG